MPDSNDLLLGGSCSICFSNIDSEGPHVLAAIQCGHMFGKSCIEKWIALRKKCPQCNQTATKRHVRRLFPCLSAGGETSQPLTVDLQESSDTQEARTTPRRCALEKENASLKRMLEELRSQNSSEPLATRPKYDYAPELQFSKAIDVYVKDDGSVFVVAVISGSQEGSLVTSSLICVGDEMTPERLRSRETSHAQVIGQEVRCLSICSNDSVVLGTASGDLFRWSWSADRIETLAAAIGCPVWVVVSLPNYPQATLAGDSRGYVRLINDGNPSQVVSLGNAPIHSVCILDSTGMYLRVLVGSVLGCYLVSMCLDGSREPHVIDLSETISPGAIGLVMNGSVICVSYRGNTLSENKARHQLLSVSDDGVVKPITTLLGHNNRVSLMKASLTFEADSIVIISPCERRGLCVWRVPKLHSESEYTPRSFLSGGRSSVPSKVFACKNDGSILVASISPTILKLQRY